MADENIIFEPYENKIIKTVHNDLIYGYGERLVKIYDNSCEVLQEIEEK